MISGNSELQLSGRAHGGCFLELMEEQTRKAKNNATNYIYHTFWFLIRKADHIAIGSTDFKDVPDKNGEIEIGYGLGKEFQHCGYMTEAVSKMYK